MKVQANSISFLTIWWSKWSDSFGKLLMTYRTQSQLQSRFANLSISEQNSIFMIIVLLTWRPNYKKEDKLTILTRRKTKKTISLNIMLTNNHWEVNMSLFRHQQTRIENHWRVQGEMEKETSVFEWRPWNRNVRNHSRRNPFRKLHWIRTLHGLD